MCSQSTLTKQSLPILGSLVNGNKVFGDTFESEEGTEDCDGRKASTKPRLKIFSYFSSKLMEGNLIGQ